MSKYDFDYAPHPNSPALIPGEQVLWQGTPKKNAFILNKILGLLPVAVIWLALDSFFIRAAFSANTQMLGFVIPFFLLHLFPVWLWLGNALTAAKRWKNTAYYVTNRRILIQTGFIAQNLQTVYYKDIQNVNLRIGVIDKLLGVGDIHFDLGTYQTRDKRKTAITAFLDIEKPQKVYAQIQKIVLDIQTDVEFPNAYRPGENPGYNTQYRG